MKVMKSLEESEELRVFRCLNVRGDLSEKERKYYLNLEKGYEGELRFGQLMVKGGSEGILVFRYIKHTSPGA